MWRGALTAAFLLLAGHVFAHDRDRADLTDWFQSLRSKRGMPCCDGHDAHKLADVDWQSKDGHYQVRIDGKWVDIADEDIVEGPNKDGPALIWIFNGQITCFLPGAGT